MKEIDYTRRYGCLATIAVMLLAVSVVIFALVGCRSHHHITTDTTTTAVTATTDTATTHATTQSQTHAWRHVVSTADSIIVTIAADSLTTADGHVIYSPLVKAIVNNPAKRDLSKADSQTTTELADNRVSHSAFATTQTSATDEVKATSVFPLGRLVAFVIICAAIVAAVIYVRRHLKKAAPK